jgi:cytochrome b pre-mRNA-processing protein 3
MIFSLFRKNTDTPQVYEVYRAVVAASRNPVFFAEWGVPDTLTGRFDMISFHLALLFRRLRSDDPAIKDFSQAVFDLFFKDMDRSLREMGVGDLSIAKRIQKMGNIFYGLLGKMSDSMDALDPAGLEAVLARNIYAGESADHAAKLAAYAFEQATTLNAQAEKDILAGRVQFGSPS